MADQVFVRVDIDKTSGNVAFYRLSKEMKDFLNRCQEVYGEIEGVVLTKKDSGDYDWNIGFVVPDKESGKKLLDLTYKVRDLLKDEDLPADLSSKGLADD